MSLRLRLVVMGALAIIVVLSLSALGLASLFSAHVERRAMVEMSAQLDQLLAGLDRVDDKIVMTDNSGDVRFRQPYSGRYWQIELPDQIMRSRSLWDQVLSTPDIDHTGSAGQVVQLSLSGPRNTTLLAAARTVILPVRLGGQPVSAIIAMDAQEMTIARSDFLADLIPYLVMLAIVLIAAGWMQITVGLRPMIRLRKRVSDLRRDPQKRMGDDWPVEVRALTSELDALLDARAKDLQRAKMRAADLAHGLKTPLQALMGDAARMRDAGADAQARSIEEVAASMRRTVDHELSRARRLSNRASAFSPLHKTLRQVAAVVGKTPDGQRIRWSVHLDAEQWVALAPADLAEALGAIMENAARHAQAVVSLSTMQSGETITAQICDDGPGIAEPQQQAMLERFARKDERGSGMGLAIASDILTSAGGTISMVRNSNSFCVSLHLPKWQASPPN